MTSTTSIAPVLSGLRILEIGHFVAAPFCTRLLADLGADVIKVEPRSGDPVRQWGEQIGGRSLWWSMHGRNKRSIALDLKIARGQGHRSSSWRVNAMLSSKISGRASSPAWGSAPNSCGRCGRT